MDARLKSILDLGRVSNLPTVWTNVLAAWLLTGGGDLFLRCFPLLLGASLLYMAGTTLNDAIDAEFDREHRPERAIPSGIFTESQVWMIGLAEMGVGALILLVMAKAALLWVAALIAAILAYDFVHKTWEGSIYIMGACRLFLYFVAASTVGIGIPFPVVVWAVSLLAYIAGLSLVARGESTGEGTSNGQIALLGAPLLAWMLTLFNGSFSLPVLLTMGAFVGWIIFSFIELRRSSDDESEPDEESAGEDDDDEIPIARVPRFVTRLLAGIVLIDAMVVAFAAGWLAVVFIAVIPFTLQLQRRFAAT